MPVHHLSKRDHQHHHAKVGLERLVRGMGGGQPLSDEQEAEHTKLKAAHRAADTMPHLFYCALGGHAYDPSTQPDVRLFCHAARLQDGTMVHPDYDPLTPGRQLEIPVGICGPCGAAKIEDWILHDWSKHDHEGRPINGG